MAKPNHFCLGYIWTFWYFDVSVWPGETNIASQGCANRHWLTSTGTFNHPQTAPGRAWKVGECLLVSVCFCWCQLELEWCLEDVLGVFGWCLWMFVVFGCVLMVVWMLIPCRVENSHCFGTALKGKIFSPGHTDKKYQNVHIYPEQKWLGFAGFLVF